MAEMEYRLKNPSEVVSSRERNFSQQHFRQAVSLFHSMGVNFQIQDLVETAYWMESSGFSAVPLLRSAEFRLENSIHEDERQISMSGLVRVNAVLGNDEVVDRILPQVKDPLNDYAYLLWLKRERGQDQSGILQKVRDLANNKYFDRWGRKDLRRHTWQDIHIGRILADAGKDEEALDFFAKAENVIGDQRKQFLYEFNSRMFEGKNIPSVRREAFDSINWFDFEGMQYGLLRNYAQAGFFSKALDIAEILKEDSSHYYWYSINEIAQEQLLRGLMDDAVQTTKDIGGAPYYKARARQSVMNVQQHRPFQEIDDELSELNIGTRSDDDKKTVGLIDFISIHADLAEASQKSGDFSSANDHFKKAWNAAGEEDRWTIFGVPMSETDPMTGSLTIAKALDAAGFDATEAYRFAVKKVMEFPMDKYDWVEFIDDGKMQILTIAIHELCDNGYLDLARSAIDNFKDNEQFNHLYRPKLTAYLAAAESKAANASVNSEP
ncbi:MAG TPA: hypothetical protein VG965_05355 [Patescibacteria group bacterium]|nr:hypothetical protein [Patescibacteria group bacterium]